MKVVCPCCAAEYDLDVAINEANARRFMALLREFPAAFIGPLIQYLRLHKPAKSALTWTKMLKVSRELAPMVSGARVVRNGSTWVAPVDLWVSCAEGLVNNPPGDLRLPLKGNGYLIAIVAGQAEKAAAAAENDRERERRRRGQDHRAGMQSVRQALGSRGTTPGEAKDG